MEPPNPSVGCVRPARLKPGAIASSQSRGDVIRGCRHVTVACVAPRQVVDATSELANGAGRGASAQSQVHGVAGTEVDEVGGCEDGLRALLSNPSQFSGIQRRCVFAHLPTEIVVVFLSTVQVNQDHDL